MPVPASINDLSTTAGSNSPAGSESPTTTDNYFRAFASFIAVLRDGKAASGANNDITSLAALSVGGLANGSVTAPDLNGAQTGSAPIYGVRAWVNFNGTGTVAIRASGNVSSITDNGTGDYTVNFTTAMPDANYSINVNASSFSGATFASPAAIFRDSGGTLTVPTTTSFRTVIASAGAAFDPDRVFVQVVG